MVATKISEVAGKGWGWYSSSDQGSSSSSSSPQRKRSMMSSTSTPSASAYTSSQSSRNSSSASSPPTRSRANSDVDVDVDTSTQSSSIYFLRAAQNSASIAFSSLFAFSAVGKDKGPSDISMSDDSPSTTSSNNSLSGRRANIGATPNSSTLLSPTLLKLIHNPYIGVRGPGRQDRIKPQQSMEAVRNLLYVVPIDDTKFDHGSDDESILDLSQHKPREHDPHSSPHAPSLWSSLLERATWYKLPRHSESSSSNPVRNCKSSGDAGTNHSSPEETASQLVEGTLRAYRDLALDEAVELHASLRYYSDLWERPLWSWFQAGPMVWLSPEGYNHQDVGQKVSQIQAVLARRLSTIGELQQHLLKSGWQRGVAQWGFLGEGGEWAAISGTDGRMEDDNISSRARSASIENAFSKHDSADTAPPLTEPYTLRRRTSDQLLHHPTPVKHELPIPAPTSKTSNLPERSRHHNQLYYTNLFVKKNDGGRILVDGTALAEWSIDAMCLVRKQLFRAANGKILLPFRDNWRDHSLLEEEVVNPDPMENAPSHDEIFEVSESGDSTLTNDRQGCIPRWSSTLPSRTGNAGKRTKISDLPLLVEEVSALLDVMEEVMGIQRARRLEKLKPPSWWRQNWLLSSVCAPLACYVFYSLSVKGDSLQLMKSVSQTVAGFFQEHVVRPCFAIYHELTKGTEYFSDRAARETAISTLKKMIRSWLDETYPEMLDKDKEELSEAMDISLIEITKERSMKTIYELNSVLRMSFIEAQFIKKEMMNALVALDEMQASTNFNMNLAAITPFVLLVWSVKKVSSYIFYTTFKWGKSRAETYASFLHILTEIERLLIMRLNPPNSSPSSICILDSDDLGMLMLHLHELRTIMWNERRRFSLDVLRSVSEDLAELSGERGAVSVQQQLHIVERMSRTYAFLKHAGSQE